MPPALGVFGYRDYEIGLQLEWVVSEELGARLGDYDLFLELYAFAAVAAADVGLDAHDHAGLHHAVDSPVIPRGGEEHLGVFIALPHAVK